MSPSHCCATSSISDAINYHGRIVNTGYGDAYADIVGCWERIDFSEEAKKKINEIEPWPIRYQWYCFETDGTLYTYGSTDYTKQTSTSLREMFKLVPKEISYSFPQKGIIKTEHRSGKQTIIWASTFMGNTVSFDQKTIEKGTLIMALYDSQKNKPVYYRYLKRVP